MEVYKGMSFMSVEITPVVPQNPRVALYVTCLVDLMRPEIGFAAIKLLEHAGCEVVVPEGHTIGLLWRHDQDALPRTLLRRPEPSHPHE
jgi:Fe-S oxidoreductase